MSEETQKLAGFIKKAGRTQRMGEFQCPLAKGFYVKISYASKFILNQIYDASREVKTNLRTREREERLNDEKLRKQYCQKIILDWRGLTLEKIDKIIPGLEYGDEDPERDILYVHEVAEEMLAASLEFENWILDIATNVENFQHIAEEKQEQYENLS